MKTSTPVGLAPPPLTRGQSGVSNLPQSTNSPMPSLRRLPRASLAVLNESFPHSAAGKEAFRLAPKTGPEYASRRMEGGGGPIHELPQFGFHVKP